MGVSRVVKDCFTVVVNINYCLIRVSFFFLHCMTKLILAAPCKKKARLSLGENGKENHDTGYQLPILENERSPLRQLQSKLLLSHDSKCTSIEGKLLPRWEKRKVFRRPPMSCEAVTITRMDGQRLYLSVRADKEDETSSANSKVKAPPIFH